MKIATYHEHGVASFLHGSFCPFANRQQLTNGGPEPTPLCHQENREQGVAAKSDAVEMGDIWGWGREVVFRLLLTSKRTPVRLCSGEMTIRLVDEGYGR